MFTENVQLNCIIMVITKLVFVFVSFPEQLRNIVPYLHIPTELNVYETTLLITLTV